MRPLILLTIGAAAILGGVATGAAFAPEPTLKEITLQRTACFGTCPVYTLTLRADGTAIYRGEAHVERKGAYRGTFWGRDLVRLRDVLTRVNAAKWKPDYALGVTDQASQILTIVTEKGRKTVREYGSSGPADLWTVQTLVDGIGSRVRDWKPVAK
ncbi:hypothetical protein EON77_17820 [bacterium]|nr:MAG: hypothetical protein EON77_17820 [bacterium]